MTPPPDLPQCAAVAFVEPGYIHGFVSHVAAPTVPDATAYLPPDPSGGYSRTTMRNR